MGFCDIGEIVLLSRGRQSDRACIRQTGGAFDVAQVLGATPMDLAWQRALDFGTGIRCVTGKAGRLFCQ